MKQALIVWTLAIGSLGIAICTEKALAQATIERSNVSSPQGRAGDGEIRRGKIKRLELGKLKITIRVNDEDIELAIREDTRILGANGSSLRERMKGFDEGAEVQFQAASVNGVMTARALRLPREPVSDARANPQFDSSRLISLPELGLDEYSGFKGGLYPEGKNNRPKAHETAGVALARSIRPLDRSGIPASDGSIVLLSIGMSNATQEFSAFKQLADRSRGETNSRLVIVDGAQGGMTAAVIRNPDDNARGTLYWNTVDERLSAAHVSRQQVQAVWIKEADAGPTQGFPKYAETLRDELGEIVRILQTRFPNLKLAYLSPRTYGGFARTRLNPEPYAYESGFAVKWLIERQLQGEPALNFDPARGDVRAPWLSWGPYLWANANKTNLDGLSYEEGDFGDDGTHPSQSGRRKVAQALWKFFTSDATARPWFVADDIK